MVKVLLEALIARSPDETSRSRMSGADDRRRSNLSAEEQQVERLEKRDSADKDSAARRGCGDAFPSCWCLHRSLGANHSCGRHQAEIFAGETPTSTRSVDIVARRPFIDCWQIDLRLDSSSSINRSVWPLAAYIFSRAQSKIARRIPFGPLPFALSRTYWNDNPRLLGHAKRWDEPPSSHQNAS